MDILIIFRLLFRKIWWLVIIPAVIIVLAVVLTINMPLKYQSTAQLATGFTQEGQIQVTDERMNLRDAGVKFSNLVETMTSELILTLCTYKLALHDWKESDVPFKTLDPDDEAAALLTPQSKEKFIKIIEEKYEKMELLSSYSAEDQMLIEVLAGYGYLSWQLIENLSVFRVRDTDYVKVQYLSSNPIMSAFVVNNLSKEYIRYENSLNKNFSGQSVDFFRKQFAAKEQALQQATKAYNDFKTATGVLSYEGQSDARITQVSEYELMKENAESEISRLRLSIADVNRRLSQLNSGDNRAEINGKIVEIRNKIDQLNEQYRQSGSTDTELANSIKDLKFQLQVQMTQLADQEALEGAGSGYTKEQLEQQRDEYQLALQVERNKVAQINSKLRQLGSNMSGFASNEARMERLRSELENAKDEYNEAQSRYNTELSKAMVSETSVKLIIAGQPNGNPESSKRWIIVLMAGVASFFICAFVIVIMEFMDARLKTPVQFKKLVNMNLIGTIPFIPIKDPELPLLFKNNKVEKPERETFKHFLRKLRYEMERKDDSVYLISSNKQGEGKTFIILSLAFSLSLIKKKILIIDTNFRNNALTRILLPDQADRKRIKAGQFLLNSPDFNREEGKDAKYQKSENKADTDEEFVSGIVSPTAHRQIHIIGNTGEQASPSEIFAGRDFQNMIKQLKLNYDYIFLEGPSLNEFSDTRELIEYSDKVVTVFSADSVIKQIDRESLEFLNGIKDKLSGGVLNKLDIKDLKQ
ncbi:exopolysaccharide transport family protein [Fulvivirga sediminis]|uniref:AAA family ATPase n=1 Tax=Fulvivirga sediminis TaxID=2803949 RepID=A0A937K123_9BACT|nr:AAA family ATPase [Fulvivirga sediminis]MBL3658179.1 AAA family ATPase [Fulvivirga sediminis]